MRLHKGTSQEILLDSFGSTEAKHFSVILDLESTNLYEKAPN